MGRELRRVAIDFDWPLNKVWSGFINPHYWARQCCRCDGSGYSDFAQHLHDQWYGNAPFRPKDNGSVPFGLNHPAIAAMATRNCHGASCGWEFQRESQRLANLFNCSWMHHLNDEDVRALCDERRLIDFTHVWSKGEGWVAKDPIVIPSAREVNERMLGGFGHDSINAWVCIKAKCRRAGQSETCSICQGHGDIWDDPAQKATYESWESTDPPAGDGWQLWETVSEGSPVSPVFATAVELAEWLGEQRHNNMDYDGWLKFLTSESGWAPSLVAVDGVLMTGTEYVVSREVSSSDE